MKYVKWLSVIFMTILCIICCDRTRCKLDNDVTGYIFIGDSRTVGMNMYLHFEDDSEHTYMVAQENKGYKWLMNTGISEIDSIRDNDTDADEWEYIILMGVNDPENVDKYIEWAENINEATVHFVSVNPLEDELKNKSVEEFNDRLRNANLDYIDTYTYLWHIGYESDDGIHYKEDTYREIYEFICAEINKSI